MDTQITQPTQPTINSPIKTPEEQLEERERAIALLSFLPETKSLTLYCKRTGVAIATMQLLTQAGKLPFLSNWSDSQAFHPLFSLSQNRLLAWTRSNWNRIFKNAALDRVSIREREQFQVAFMAILHSFDSILQEQPAIPAFETVAINMQRLLELGYWHNFLESKRFKFPTLRINKLNANTNLRDIGVYLDICESVKSDYENSKEAKHEEARLEAARRAEKAVRGSHVRAVSKKMLWNWFLASLADSNSKKFTLPEWVEWKEDSAKLWFASENTQLQYSISDVDSIEDVFLQNCALGTTVSNAFKQELQKVRAAISNHNSIFEIDWVATIKTGAVRVDAAGNRLSAPVAPEHPGAQPMIGAFSSRTEFVRAEAKWKVAMMQWKAWHEANPVESNNDDSTERSEVTPSASTQMAVEDAEDETANNESESIEMENTDDNT